MRVDREALRLYAVTDRAWARDEAALFRQIEAAVRGGAGVVQLREKDMEPAAFLEEAKRFVALCRRLGLAGKLISVPRQVTSDCGIAWSAPPELRETLEIRLAEAGVETAGFYELMV